MLVSDDLSFPQGPKKDVQFDVKGTSYYFHDPSACLQVHSRMRLDTRHLKPCTLHAGSGWLFAALVS